MMRGRGLKQHTTGLAIGLALLSLPCGASRLEAAGSAPRDFLSTYLPRVRLNRAEIQNQGEEGTLVSCAFQAIKRTAATGFDETTIVFQDSAA